MLNCQILLSDTQELVSLYVLRYTPPRDGDKGKEEAARLLESLVFTHPADALDQKTEDFLNAVVSLCTFMDICMGDDELNFVKFSGSVVALSFCYGLLFVFRALNQPDSSDYVAQHTLQLITRSVRVSLGESASASDVESLLREKGESIVASATSAIPIREPSSGCVLSSLGAVGLLSDEVLGVVCMCDQAIVSSTVQLDIVRFLVLIGDAPGVRRIYFDKGMREELVDVSECWLTRIDVKAVSVYVLSTVELADNIVSKLKDIAATISEPSFDVTKPKCPVIAEANCAKYDTKLFRFCGPALFDNSESKKGVVYAHEEMRVDKRLQELIIRNESGLFYAAKRGDFEHFSSIYATLDKPFDTTFKEALRRIKV